MLAKMLRTISRGVWLLAILAFVALTLRSDAQSCCSGGGSSKSDAKDRSSRDSGFVFPITPNPYEGQLFCPVTGEKLGLRQPPVPVQTTIGEKKPSLFGKIVGKKPIPGEVIYVCCRDCVAKVQKDPSIYFNEVKADRACFGFSYANAPAERPSRVRPDRGPAFSTAMANDTRVQMPALGKTEGAVFSDIPAADLYQGQKSCPVTGAKLGSMGAPMPVTVGGQSIYVCCRSCVARVQSEPDTYLAKVAAERAGR